MNCFHGVQIRKNIKESYKYKCQNWMETEYDGNVLVYWWLPEQELYCKFKKTRWLR